MKIKNFITSMAFVLIGVVVFAQNSKNKKVMLDADNARSELMKADYGLEQFSSTSVGYVIFPNVGEGALIVGGASGNGVVYDNGKAIGMANLKKLDVGLQAGGQTFSEIIFFETEKAFEEFKQGQFTLSAEASAVALDKGKTIKTTYKDGIVVFAKPKKGLMADISVGGQKIEFTEMENVQ